jgi:hypothetical protein
MEIPAETEFSDQLRPTRWKADCCLITTHTDRGLSFLNMGGRGNHVVDGIMG